MLKFFVGPVFVLFLSGCNAMEECPKHFDSRGEIRACQIGSDEIARYLLESRQEIPNERDAAGLCQQECLSRYDAGALPPSNSDEYFKGLNQISDAFVACEKSCRVTISKERLENESLRRLHELPNRNCLDRPLRGALCE